MSECPVAHMTKRLLAMWHNSSHTFEGVKACLDVTLMRRECLASLWMSHVTHVNESCHTCEWVMSHMWMSHVTRVNEWEPCHIHEWMSASHVPQFMWHIGMGKGVSSCHTYEWLGASLCCGWVMPHVCMNKEAPHSLVQLQKAQCGIGCIYM